MIDVLYNLSQIHIFTLSLPLLRRLKQGSPVTLQIKWTCFLEKVTSKIRKVQVYPTQSTPFVNFYWLSNFVSKKFNPLKYRTCHKIINLQFVLFCYCFSVSLEELKSCFILAVVACRQRPVSKHSDRKINKLLSVLAQMQHGHPREKPLALLCSHSKDIQISEFMPSANTSVC